MVTHVRLLSPHCLSVMASQRGRSEEAWGFLVVAEELLGKRGDEAHWPLQVPPSCLWSSGVKPRVKPLIRGPMHLPVEVS